MTELNIEQQIYEMADEVVSYLRQKQWTLSVAESCTGGLLSASLTDIAGVSAVFDGGIISYSNDIKKLLLNVSDVTLNEYGAVSHETAQEMALGCLKATNSDLSVSITGIAGPSGGDKLKPVGTVYFGLACQIESIAEPVCTTYRAAFKGDRLAIRQQSVLYALKLIKDKSASAS